MDEIEYLISLLNSKQIIEKDINILNFDKQEIPKFPDVNLEIRNINSKINTKYAKNIDYEINIKETEIKQIESKYTLPNISNVKKVRLTENYMIESNNTNKKYNKKTKNDSEIDNKYKENFKKRIEENTTKQLLHTMRYLDFRPYIDDLAKSKSRFQNPNKDSGYYYKIVGSESLLVQCLLEDNGFIEATKLDQEWTITWASSCIKKKFYKKLKPYQKVNHFPRNSEITRKDLLYKNISKFKTLFPTNKSFNFIPESFILPNEKTFLEDAMEDNPNQIWIVKPVAWSQGRGIFVTNNITDIIRDGQSIACRYISNPYLIDGYKFDMRIYVLVTSVFPLRIYVYEDGFARFATEKFYLGQPFKASKFMHLTNYAVNKQSKNFIPNIDPFADGVGSKWSLNALKKYFMKNNINWNEISEKINDVIIKTFISAEENLVNAFVNCVEVKNSCFELFGFDILLDSNLNPWLIEVNLSPSIHFDSPLDLKIKGELIAEIFDVARIIPLNLREKDNESMPFCDYSKYFNSNIPSPLDLKVLKEISHLDVMKDFKFTKEIKEMIWDTDEELKRVKNFRRIFPSETSLNYRKFFINENPINLFLSLREFEKSENKIEISKKIKKHNLINFCKKNK